MRDRPDQGDECGAQGRKEGDKMAHSLRRVFAVELGNPATLLASVGFPPLRGATDRNIAAWPNSISISQAVEILHLAETI